MVSRAALLAGLLVVAASASAASTWCLGLGALGPIRAGMRVEEVLRLADWPGMETKKQPQDCWYLNYDGNGANFSLMIIKSTRGLFPEIARAVSQIHTYRTPEIICLPIVDGSEAYLQWVADSVKPL